MRQMLQFKDVQSSWCHLDHMQEELVRHHSFVEFLHICLKDICRVLFIHDRI